MPNLKNMFDKSGFDMVMYTNIPKEWFKDLEDAKFLGRPIMEYRPEELAAIAVRGWKLFQDVEVKKTK